MEYNSVVVQFRYPGSDRFYTKVYSLSEKEEADEVYHLGAQSHVKVSFEMPEYTGSVSGLGTTRILEAIRRSGIKARFYQASSSEIFGNTPAPQNEETPFYPRSPYSIAKAYSYWITVNYREAYGIFAANGILSVTLLKTAEPNSKIVESI